MRARTLTHLRLGSGVPVLVLALATVTLLAGGLPAQGAATRAPLWTARYFLPDTNSAAMALAVSPDGTRVFVGGRSEGMTGSNYLTVAYDQRTGAKLWTRRTSGGTDELHAIAVSPSGSMLYVTGTREMPVTDEDVFTIAYDAATGTTRWSARYNQSRGGESLEDFGDAIAVSPDGSKVFVAGSSGGPFALLVAYNAETGARLWARSLQRSSWFFALAASPDSSRVYTTGGVDTPTQFSNDLTMAFNASNGSTLWSRQYNGPAGGEDGGNLIAVSPDGSRLYVSGASSKLGEPGWTAGFLDWATIAYRANTGTRLWGKRYESGVPLSIAVAPAGENVYVYG